MARSLKDEGSNVGGTIDRDALKRYVERAAAVMEQQAEHLGDGRYPEPQHEHYNADGEPLPPAA